MQFCTDYSTLLQLHDGSNYELLNNRSDATFHRQQQQQQQFCWCKDELCSLSLVNLGFTTKSDLGIMIKELRHFFPSFNTTKGAPVIQLCALQSGLKMSGTRFYITQNATKMNQAAACFLKLFFEKTRHF